jgi:hypothetical protein
MPMGCTLYARVVKAIMKQSDLSDSASGGGGASMIYTALLRKRRPSTTDDLSKIAATC